MENRNLVIALLLVVVVWLGFNVLFPPPKVVLPPKGASKTTASQKTTSPPAVKVEESQGMRGERLENGAPVSVAAARKERLLTVDTDLYQAVFTNSGARLKSLKLKKYFVSTKPGAAHVSLIDVKNARFGTLKTEGKEGLSLSPDALYSVSVPQEAIHLQGKESRQIVFSYQDKNGVVFQKIYTFYGNRYQFNLNLKIANEGSAPARGNVSVALIHPWNKSMEGGHYTFVGPASLVGEKVKTEKVKDLSDNPVSYGKDLVWTAFENKFFMGAIVPLENAAVHANVLKSVSKSTSLVENILHSPSLTLAQGEGVNLKYLLYFGPRDLDILKNVDHQLKKAIDFGFFGPIARPLLSVLKFFYRYVGNYGVAIILLTVIIKLLFWPLTQKSYSSMKAMQTLQPQMQKIREKYKNDRDRLNKEIMELYKKNRVNPLGGCLPMIIQIPVFFALYEVLLRSIALRQAPFIFWLTDLSLKDPYYITPIIMGVTMFFQQKMSPTAMDPKQAKLLLLMPIVFTFLFLNFPSGLVIYWLVNNLLTILQQYLINRQAAVS